MKTSPRFLAVLAAAASVAWAADTRIWSLGDHSDFDKGTVKGLSLTSDGRVTLAPVFSEVFDSASVYLWALAEDSKGNIYAGGGGPGGPGARIYVLGADGKGKTLVSFDEFEIHALAVDTKDQVFAATSPDGKVYRVRSGKADLFYDPKAKYIWAMAFNRRGDLIIATGDRGEVHRVTPDGKGSLFYQTAETHARSLAFDAEDNLILGTEPGGLIVRVDANGQGFVLHQAAKREITAVAVARDGSIYAAGVGNKQAGPAPAPALRPQGAQTVTPLASPSPSSPQPAQPQRPGGAPAPAAPVPPAPPTTIPGGSEVYRIDTDGFPRRVWSHPRDIAYAIGFDQDQRPIVGTGNEGSVYRIDSELVYTELLKAPPTQVTAIHAAPNGRLYVATGNVGKVYRIGPGLEPSGTLESEVFDAGMFSQWGRLAYRGGDQGGRITFRTRSGNLDRPHSDWSAWSAEFGGADGGNVTSPPARFLQWTSTLSASTDGRSPVLNAVDVAYLPRNVAPAITEIEITPPNYRFPQTATVLGAPPQSLSLQPLGRPSPPQRRTTPAAATPSSSMQHAKGYIGARWAASDENGDTLTYEVYIRGEDEKEWKLLKDELGEPHISWDSTAFPDGEYRVRVVASDSPDNPADRARTTALVSDPFTIDNTGPEVIGLTATPAAGKLTVKWSARDALSILERAEYSVNGGAWTIVEPASGPSDWKEEQYVLIIDRPSPGELTLAVRVADEFENRSVAKIVVR